MNFKNKLAKKNIHCRTLNHFHNYVSLNQDFEQLMSYKWKYRFANNNIAFTNNRVKSCNFGQWQKIGLELVGISCSN